MKGIAGVLRGASAILAASAALLTGVFFNPGAAAAAAAPVIVYPPDRALLSGDGSLELLGFLPGAAPGTVTITGASGSRSNPVVAGSFVVKAVWLDDQARPVANPVSGEFLIYWFCSYSQIYTRRYRSYPLPAPDIQPPGPVTNLALSPTPTARGRTRSSP